MKKKILTLITIILLVSLLGCSGGNTYKVSDSAVKYKFNKNNLLSLISITVDTDKVVYEFNAKSEICKTIEQNDFDCCIEDENGILNDYNNWSYQKKGSKGYLCVECEDIDRIKKDMRIWGTDDCFTIRGFENPVIYIFTYKDPDWYSVLYTQEYDSDIRKWGEIKTDGVKDPNTVDI